MKITDDFEQFIKDRDKALLSLEKNKILAYCAKYGVSMPSNDASFWIGVHKAITGNVGLPLEFRKKSKQWLSKRGYKSLDDGEL